MNKTYRRMFIVSGFLLMTYLIVSATLVSGARSDSVEGFLENEYLPGLDIWVNQTDASSLTSGMAASTQGWEVRRFLLLPTGAENIEWEWISPDVTIKYSFYTLERDQPAFGVGATNSETGLTGYTGQSVDGVTRVDANEIAGDGSGSIVPMTWDYFNTTSNVADANQNYTVPDNEINSGILYTGGDSKTIDGYGEDIADSEGKSLYSVLNATMVGFAYSNQAELANVVWTFDQPTANAPGQEAGFLKRAWVGIKTKIQEKKNTGVSKYTGMRTAADDINKFRKIATASAAIVGIPKAAKYFHSLRVPSGHFSASQVGTASVSEGTTKRTGGLFALFIVILAIYMGIRYRKGKRGAKVLYG